MSGRRLILALALAAGLAAAGAARAQQVVADLSKHLVAITTGFAGTDVLLFGAVDGEGDVIVIVRGPETDVAVRKKSDVGGLWLNTQSLTFRGVPGFYRVAATRPLGEIVAESVAEREQIGTAWIRLATDSALPRDRIEAYRRALIRNMRAEGLFHAQIGTVTFLAQRLFRADIAFPANVPTGRYTVNVLLVRNGQIVSATTTPLFVSKIGVSAEIYDFAHARVFAYGALAVLLAGLFGFAAARFFRRA